MRFSARQISEITLGLRLGLNIVLGSLAGFDARLKTAGIKEDKVTPSQLLQNVSVTPLYYEL